MAKVRIIVFLNKETINLIEEALKPCNRNISDFMRELVEPFANAIKLHKTAFHEWNPSLSYPESIKKSIERPVAYGTPFSDLLLKFLSEEQRLQLIDSLTIYIAKHSMQEKNHG